MPRAIYSAPSWWWSWFCCAADCWNSRVSDVAVLFPSWWWICWRSFAETLFWLHVDDLNWTLVLNWCDFLFRFSTCWNSVVIWCDFRSQLKMWFSCFPCCDAMCLQWFESFRDLSLMFDLMWMFWFCDSSWWESFFCSFGWCNRSEGVIFQLLLVWWPVLDAMLVYPHDFFSDVKKFPKELSDVNETALKLWCNVRIFFLMWCSFPEIFLIAFLISFLWSWFEVFLMQWKWPEDFLMIEVGPFVFFDVRRSFVVLMIAFWCLVVDVLMPENFSDARNFFSDVNLTLFCWSWF